VGFDLQNSLRAMIVGTRVRILAFGPMCRWVAWATRRCLGYLVQNHVDQSRDTIGNDEKIEFGIGLALR